MKDLSATSTLEMARISSSDLAATDLAELTGAVSFAADPTEILERLTAYVARRLEASECSCLVVDSASRTRDLVYAADWLRPEVRGQRLAERALSYEIQAVLDRGIEWTRTTSGKEVVTTQGEGTGDELIDGTGPPVLRGALTESDARSSGSVMGLIVPLISHRRVVGIQWIGAKTTGEPFADWELALARCAGAVAGQAVCTIARDRAHREEAHALGLDHSRQLEKLEATIAKLRETIEARNQELSICAHDLRAPIGVIQGHVSIMRNLTTASDSVRKSLDAVERQTQRILTMVDDLLSERRQRAMGLRLEACDLDQLFTGWIEDFDVMAQNREVRLITHLSPDLGIRRIDAGKVLEILTNLLDNAFKFSGSGGEVELRVAMPEEQTLRIGVADSGPGLSPEALESGFQLFYRDTDRSGVGGAGVGLASVGQFIQAMGGQVSAENRPGRAGAMFTIVLPAYIDELAGDDTNPIPVQLFRVLVIDADRQALHELTSALSQQYEVLTARTLREAQWVLHQGPIDCAIIDLNAPLMTGFATAVELRRERSRAHLPVLFTSEADLDAVPLRRRGGRLQDVFVKPIAPEDLLKRVGRAIAQSIHRALEVPTQRDPLTGLATREGSVREVERQIERCRSRGAMLSLLMVAVNDFDELCQECGSTVGEALLQQFGRTLEEVTRSEELVGRWDPASFLCVLPGTSTHSGRVVAERIREQLGRLRAGSAQATVSCGLTTAAPRDELDAEHLIEQAHEALIMARDERVDSVVAWRPPPEHVESQPAPRGGILLVSSDEQGLPTVVATIEEHTDLPVEAATTIEGALETARRTMPQLALIDVGLPDRAGYELLRVLRQGAGDPPLPVIAIVGNEDPSAIGEAEAAGFNACIARSSRWEHLVDEVTRWLR